MAISTDSAIEFFGAQDSLDNSSAAVNDNTFSVAGDLNQWTNDDDALYAYVILEVDYSSAPTANSVINMYVRPINIVGTSDAEVPDANYQHVFVGAFPVNDVTTVQFIPKQIKLENSATSSVYEFYIENQTGQQIQAGWDIHITPKAVGPHP